MSTKHKVVDGDSIVALAADHGLLPAAIIDHPENAALVDRRKNGYVLFDEHDEVHIPERETSKQETAQINRRTTFRRKAMRERLRLRFVDEKQIPRAGLAYLLEVDSAARLGKTGANGQLEEWVSATAKQAKLTLRDGDYEEVYELRLSCLVPDDEVWGAQQRLMNLGYDCGDEYGAPGVGTDAAIRTFQLDCGMKPTGLLDEATLTWLEREYRS